MKRLVMTSALVMALAMAGCGDSETDSTEITQADDGTVVSVANGGTIEIVLRGNPTTGYQWEVAATDESLLTSAGSTYAADSDAIGSGGTYRFQFNAAAAGEVRLQMVHKRSWEPDVLQTFEVTIRIS